MAKNLLSRKGTILKTSWATTQLSPMPVLKAESHWYKWLKWVPFDRWLPSPLEIRWEVWSREELGEEPLLHCIGRNQLRWFKYLANPSGRMPRQCLVFKEVWGQWGASGTDDGKGWQVGGLDFLVKDTAPITWTKIRCKWQRQRENIKVCLHICFLIFKIKFVVSRLIT